MAGFFESDKSSPEEENVAEKKYDPHDYSDEEDENDQTVYMTEANLSECEFDHAESAIVHGMLVTAQMGLNKIHQL